MSVSKRKSKYDISRHSNGGAAFGHKLLSARNILLTLPNIQPKREPLLWMQMDQQQEEATEGIA